MTGLFNGIVVEANFAYNEDEIKKYIQSVIEDAECTEKDIKRIKLTLNGDDIDIEYTKRNAPFERIRRITGYLTGTVDRWGNSKRAELSDRVKHA